MTRHNDPIQHYRIRLEAPCRNGFLHRFAQDLGSPEMLTLVVLERHQTEAGDWWWDVALTVRVPDSEKATVMALACSLREWGTLELTRLDTAPSAPEP